MGAWGFGSFDNDQALDFLSDLEESGPELLRECVDMSTWKEPTLDECTSTDLIAASEIVAAMTGRPAADLPEEASQWVADHQGLDLSHLISHCRSGLAKVVQPGSGLNELWEENKEQYPKWKQAVQELADRLNA